MKLWNKLKKKNQFRVLIILNTLSIMTLILSPVFDNPYMFFTGFSFAMIFTGMIFMDY